MGIQKVPAREARRSAFIKEIGKEALQNLKHGKGVEPWDEGKKDCHP